MNLKNFFRRIFYAFLAVYSIPLFLSVFKHFFSGNYVQAVLNLVFLLVIILVLLDWYFPMK
ncbi:hypothetical protein [Streptococcus danieliae]|uniref:Uncharacterized protein n=1 Tax=Streptococcus danieliae TaxID=747656 RepID=A0A7Z0M756_9STRE|nr:hypothetical protein [Streptococcus danieliae]MBF0699775.1 hypothetical protein [Streptococcus danieliae]NYS96951.1 hypothetical protein [Streptococcus danieliae]